MYLTGRAQDGAQFGGGPLVGNPIGDDIFVARLTGAGGPVWSALYGSPGNEVGSEIAIDAGGTSYVAGTFQQTVDFGGGDIAAAGGDDAFVASYAASGSYRWSRTWGSAGDDRGSSVAIDPAAATLFVSGTFAGAIDFGGGTIASAGGADGFLVGLDPVTGAPRWHVTWGSAGEDGCNGVATDAEGNVYVAGFFAGTIELGGETLTSAGDQDLVLFSVKPDGTVRWATRHGGAGLDRGLRVKSGPHGEIVTGGVFQQQATIGGEPLTAAGGEDGFILATTRSGAALWARGVGGAGEDEVQSVALDAMGRVYATGAFSGDVSFGGPILTSAGGYDTFLFRVDPELVLPD